MAVIDAVKIVIENYPEDKIELLKAPNHPQNNEMGLREIYFSKYIYIDKADFQEIAPNNNLTKSLFPFLSLNVRPCQAMNAVTITKRRFINCLMNFYLESFVLC